MARLSQNDLDAIIARWNTVDRDALGQHVRRIWTVWALEQHNPKPSWLAPWEEMSEPDREVDMRIGLSLWSMGNRDVQALLAEIRELQDEADYWRGRVRRG